MDMTMINKRIDEAVRGIEPDKPTYTCERTGARCTFMGGEVMCPHYRICDTCSKWLHELNH